MFPLLCLISAVLHAGTLLSHDSPHPLVLSAVWGIHRFPGVAVFGAHLYERVINTVYMLYIIWNKFLLIHPMIVRCPDIYSDSYEPHIVLHYSHSAGVSAR